MHVWGIKQPNANHFSEDFVDIGCNMYISIYHKLYVIKNIYIYICIYVDVYVYLNLYMYSFLALTLSFFGCKGHMAPPRTWQYQSELSCLFLVGLYLVSKLAPALLIVFAFSGSAGCMLSLAYMNVVLQECRNPMKSTQFHLESNGIHPVWIFQTFPNHPVHHDYKWYGCCFFFTL